MLFLPFSTTPGSNLKREVAGRHHRGEIITVHTSAGPSLSVVVIFHDMQREAERTLYTLSASYQRGMDESPYEVIVIDNGSSRPLDEFAVTSKGSNFRYVKYETDSASPASAINHGVRMASADIVSVCIDGARMLSPGALGFSLGAFSVFENPVVCLLAWHLGEEIQNLSALRGYDQAAEDELLDTVNWKSDGYELFNIATLASSSRHGWFSPLPEVNFITVHKSLFNQVDGFDERFQSPGGGLVGFHFFEKLCALPDTDLVHLLGEGSFHQFHNGVSTNVPPQHHPWESFNAEYQSITGKPYCPPEYKPRIFGHVPAHAERFLSVRTPSAQNQWAS